MSTWSKVSLDLVQDPDNHKLYIDLVKAVERDNINKASSEYQVELLRISYRKLLLRYPYLYKYWIKFAQWEFKLGNTENAEKIYSQGLFHMRYCLELWVSYLNFKILTIHDESEVLQLFEKARKSIGYHYFSCEFYQIYLEYLLNYRSETNQYLKKYYILLRIILEIPIYNYEYFYNIWLNLIKKEDVEINKYIIPTSSKYDDANSIRKLYIDAYITTQYHSWQLYKFESRINPYNFNFKLVPNQQFLNWEKYLEYLQVSDYPLDSIEMNYFRFLYICSNYPSSWISLSNFYIAKGKYNNSRNVLKMGYKYTGSYEILLKLVDLEIFLKQYCNAKSLIVNYLQFNNEISLEVYEKLINLERLENSNDDEYLLQLIRQIIDQTLNPWFFNVLINYDIEKDKLFNFINEYKDRFGDDQSWKNCYNVITNDDNDEIYEDYETAMSKI